MQSAVDPPEPATISGPYGPARKVDSVQTAKLVGMYFVKCDVDVSDQFRGEATIDLYECARTGMKFWRPESVAGDEDFYRRLSHACADYYREWRWEYDRLAPYLKRDSRLLEVGCGRGYFLKSCEGKVAYAKGLELNTDAILNKVTAWDIDRVVVEDMAAGGEQFDVVCSFQVLEHVAEPARFLAACVACTRPGGVLAVSVPDNRHVPHATRSDAFDLPPHHLNQFTPDALRKIAGAHGLRIETVVTQTRAFQHQPVTAGTSRRLSFKVARKITSAAFQWIYRAANEPGHTMLAVFRKD